MSATTTPKPSLVHNVQTDRKIVAVCEWSTFDVWGNARDGYEVNDVYRCGEITIPAECTIHNVPRLPNEDSGSITAECLVTFAITDKAIKKALGIKFRIDVGGDDVHYTIDRKRDGYPIAEITILRFEEVDA